MIPSRDVLAAFGLDAEPQPLAGGQESSVRVGDAVLKPAGDPEEEAWRADLYERIVPDGFRMPRPLRAADGRVVVDGWVGFEFLEGEHSLERWDDVLATCDRFHAALRGAARLGPHSSTA